MSVLFVFVIVNTKREGGTVVLVDILLGATQKPILRLSFTVIDALGVVL